ncbi:MAG: hypothetical protein KDD42_02535 [Bdellovibrionales bacterium]|nr:hypothetical protein [Bdellovibrionales bacterium]
MSDIELQVVDPFECKKIVPALTRAAWLYKFREPRYGWIMSLATHGEPHSGNLSLGGFRIAPDDRASLSTYSNDAEALGLAIGMEHKIAWARLIRAGGPLAVQHLDNIVGGKCVLLPSKGSRVGEPLDSVLLDFSIECFQKFERESGLSFNTGQDLGHGLLSDGCTYSLDYVHQRYSGCINTDTSMPTADGNLYMLLGMLKGLRIDLSQAKVGIIGCGKIGGRILEHLMHLNVDTAILECLPSRRQQLAESYACQIFSEEEHQKFFEMELDALVLNTNGGSLTRLTAQTIANNPRIKLLCGSENLPFADDSAKQILFDARKLYCPTELGGMFGFLAAAEVFYCSLEDKPFDMTTVLEATKRLEAVGREVVQHIVRNNYKIDFPTAVKAIYGDQS